ncbi:hypothetical protein EYB45_06840 [Erythrobacteraceae bacterium CFH 75059]|uniref:hypothetical protein n=1 Tax=Qipengyuania thermophila TaxID=2509361 RepID=UPI001021852D|nr:hypothetical protein [Qipengyuania thermophila]TCD05202.1 hypothetical protein EYB45_06840 [Erythrobacteraceae bacterium CFH 75059]
MSGSHSSFCPQTAFGTWQTLVAADRLHHAWLLSGPAGSGKRAFAVQAAAHLLGQPVSKGAVHPDLLLITREPRDGAEARKAEDGKPFERRRNITIAQIRAMQQRLTIGLVGAGQWRVILIDAADDLEAGAANALLKSLEEPPRRTVFLLVADRPAQLLPTIRSRCQVLRFSIPHNAADTRTEPDGAAATGNAATRGQGREAVAAARQELARQLPPRTAEHFAALDRSYAELARIENEVASFNYDPDLLRARIAGLLAGAPLPRGGGNDDAVLHHHRDQLP